MTTDLVEKCAIAASLADNSHNGEPFAQNYRNITLAVIDALADGVTDEMAKLAVDVYEDQPRLIDHRVMRRALSAAIRAAKGGAR